jgi:multiple sugar transport system permease protein
MAVGGGTTAEARTARAGRLRELVDFWRTPSLSRRRALTAYAFMGPSLILLAVFVVWPMTQALYVSFLEYSVLGVSEWIGLRNYTTLVGDPAFLNALRNTIYYAVVTTPVSIALALGLALLLNRRIALRGFFRSAIFLPVVTSLAIVAIAWSFLLDPDIGLISYWLGKIGLQSGGWLRDPNLAMPAVMLVGIWKNVGFYMVMYLAGLQAIPQEFYEAAQVDGASRRQQLRYITWPLLANTTMFVFIIAAIATLQAFDQIFVMTRGGPFFRTETLVMLIYRLGFQQFEMGYAAAISWVLVLLIFGLSLLQIRYFNKRMVTY